MATMSAGFLYEGLPSKLEPSCEAITTKHTFSVAAAARRHAVLQYDPRESRREFLPLRIELILVDENGLVASSSCPSCVAVTAAPAPMSQL